MSLSVFRGGFDPVAAEQVAGARLPILAGLIDKLLVRISPRDRYDMHELLRQYAFDRLLESREEMTVERRHFKFFLRLAEQASQRYYSPHTAVWLDRVDVEHDNFRAALGWSLKSGESQPGLQLATELAWFWGKRFYRREGFVWLVKFLANSSSTPSLLRVKGLNNAALLICYLGDNTHAKALGEEALTMARHLGDSSSVAWSLTKRPLGKVTEQRCVELIA